MHKKITRLARGAMIEGLGKSDGLCTGALVAAPATPASAK
jgi:hypothetical protein